MEHLSKEYTLYLSSYTQSSYSILEIEELDIKKYFTDIIFSSNIGYKKMSDEFYKICINISKNKASDCIMIGDNRLEDIYMASKNGMKTIWIKNPLTENDNKEVAIIPDAELNISNFAELKQVIETIK